ncbi:MAG TPA: ROK family protein [Roseiflexaceae bacterium]|nr:ROK family protein [Roseiflexaceae bacterium]
MTRILGFDFGGTKLAVGLYNVEQGLLVARRQQATPHGGASASIAAMIDMARGLLASQSNQGLGGVGVSFGGPVAADARTVRLSMHVPGWEHQPLADILEKEFGVPARVANDGNAAALAEYRIGAGRGVQHRVYVTVSTGIGGGMVIDGRLHSGEHAWAGEIGHILLDPDGPPCPCGRNGCLEALASGLSIAREARRVLLENPDQPSSLRSVAPENVDARLVAEAARHGDTLAATVWGTAMLWLGRGLANVANIVNPGKIVVGGGLTRSGDQLFEPVRAEAGRRTLDPDLEIVPAALGDDVGILGGCALWLAA